MSRTLLVGPLLDNIRLEFLLVFYSAVFHVESYLTEMESVRQGKEKKKADSQCQMEFVESSPCLDPKSLPGRFRCLHHCRTADQGFRGFKPVLSVTTSQVMDLTAWSARRTPEESSAICFTSHAATMQQRTETALKFQLRGLKITEEQQKRGPEQWSIELKHLASSEVMFWQDPHTFQLKHLFNCLADQSQEL